jgi:hypothetical protein
MELQEVIHCEQGPRPSELAAMLAQLAEVFVQTRSSILRTAVCDFFEEADWPLLAAVGARAPPGFFRALQGVTDDKWNAERRAMALRMLAVAADLHRVSEPPFTILDTALHYLG